MRSRPQSSPAREPQFKGRGPVADGECMVHGHQRRRTTAGLVVAFAFMALLCGLLPGRADGAALCLPTGSLLSPASDDTALRFGIYPGGAAGSVEGKPDAAPEDPAARLAALELLRSTGGRLGVHIYTAYTADPAADERTALWMDGEIAAYTAAGFDVELAVRYKPAGGSRAAAITGFARFIRATVRRYGGNARFTSLQVANEANLTDAPDASDGAFAGATDALIAGVIAAKAEVRETNFAQVQVGFNWASDPRPAASTEFWKALAGGGAAFADAVDWVGLDAYPGTWFPALDVSSLLPGLAGAALDTALATLRSCHMPAAGLGPDVPIHVSENGYPTGPGRSPATQSRVLEEMVRAVARRAGAYNVSDYNWFDLRDSRSDDPHLESQYGLLRDDYSLKPAFSTYRKLIAELGSAAPDTAAPPAARSTATTDGPAVTACTRSPARIDLPRRKGWKLRSLRVMRGGKVLRTLRRSTVPASIRVALKPGKARVTVRLSTRRGRSLRTQVVRRTLTVCGTLAT